MATPTGISAQFGFAEETTYGTAVTPTRFVPFLDESIETTPDFLESAGIISGARVLRSSQWSMGVKRHEGDVGCEVMTRSIGLLLKHALGSVTGTTTQIFTPGDLTGLGLTVQVGRPDRAGTVQPFTYSGVKVQSWEIGVSSSEIATLGLGLVAQSVTTGIALASASYATTNYPMFYTGGSFSLNGSQLCVRSARISGENNLTTDRVCVGSESIDEPVEEDLREFSGEVELEFPDLVHYNRFLAGTEGLLSLAVAHPSGPLLSILANVRTDQATPTVQSRGMVVQTLSFKTIANSTSDASGMTMTYVTTDTTP